ncbi:MAG: NDP-sugar synthase [Candidatus Micrarchaeota archaeon]
MKAIILAGGLGTRLRPLTYTIPKPLLPVANRAIIDHIIERLSVAGINGVVITTNYLYEQIDNHLENSDYSIPVEVVKERRALGTAGSVRNVKKKIDGDFLVIQGDNISSIDISQQIDAHEGMVTLSLIPVADPESYGIVELGAKHRVKRFIEKPRPDQCFSNLANTGTYVISYGVLDMIPAGTYDFSLDLFPRLLSENNPISGIVQDGYWKDVGSIKNYFASNRYMLGGMLSGGVSDKGFISRNAKLVPPYIIGRDSHIGADVIIGPNTVIGQNCHIGRGSKITGSILFDSVYIGSQCRIDNSVIADKNKIRDNVSIDSGTIVGSGCTIERNARISANSLIGPLIKVQASTEISGVLSPNIEKIEKVRSILQKIPVFKKLERDELRICMTLVEFGELRDNVLGSLSQLPKDSVDKALTRLQQRGIIRGREGMFSLLYEEPERIYRHLKGRLL